MRPFVVSKNNNQTDVLVQTQTATTFVGAVHSGTTGITASTTGNIYGIYDMSGGSYEYTAAYVNNGTPNLATYSSTLVNANAKYKDTYTKAGTDNAANNYALAANQRQRRCSIRNINRRQYRRRRMARRLLDLSVHGGSSLRSWYGLR